MRKFAVLRFLDGEWGGGWRFKWAVVFVLEVFGASFMNRLAGAWMWPLGSDLPGVWTGFGSGEGPMSVANGSGEGEVAEKLWEGAQKLWILTLPRI
ncbi:hypothetical protein L1049_015139 [Liquidambar formosana]|uniref:Uncharacterized protein n=1 Tax=Liquidambar formosana TaxID=63359 RepID=A0AAP0X6B4_LIQFO